MDSAGLQPSLRDLCPAILAHPTLKRWAILGHPSGMRRVKALDRNVRIGCVRKLQADRNVRAPIT
jgi:hypothetical protein